MPKAVIAQLFALAALIGSGVFSAASQEAEFVRDCAAGCMTLSHVIGDGIH